MDEPHGKSMRAKFLFWFGLQGDYGGQKKVFFSTCMGWPHGKNIRNKNLFGLVCKIVMEVQRSYIIFMYMGVTCKKN
jgi:hypothetical protein